MKELSIEQKAKRYDEALQRAKHALDCDKNGLVNTDKPLIMSIFPELKESEDERSKKWILEYLYDGLRKSDEQFKDHFKTAIAWLEKQGEQKPTFRERYKNIAKSEWFKKTHEGMSISNENADDTNYCFDCINCENGELKATEDERIRKRIIHALHGDVLDIEETNKALAWVEKQVPIDEEKVLIGARKDVALSIMNFLDRNTLSMCLSNMECEDIENAVVDSNWLKVYNYMKKKLEKQGGQKPLIEMKSPEESLGISAKEYNEVVNSSLYGELKSTDKVEPKFKVGDWITNGFGNPIQISSIDNDMYYVNNDTASGYIKSTDKEYYLWTIQDAKDGDVLVCPKYAGDIIPNIFIFKDIKIKDNSVFCYCSFLDTFRIEGYVANADPINTDFYPATKEQRDILFKAMADAGYEWDVENKKLNKIK